MFKKIIKKLSNFKFTALLMTIISSLAGVYAIASLFLYHFAGDVDDRKGLTRLVGFSSTEDGPYVGMILFFMVLATVILSIYVIFNCVPFIKNKEKLSPKKNLLIVGEVSAVSDLVLFILMIVLLITNPQHKDIADYNRWRALLITSLPFGFLSIVGTGLYVVPFLKCNFYMPEIKRD